MTKHNRLPALFGVRKLMKAGHNLVTAGHFYLGKDDSGEAGLCQDAKNALNHHQNNGLRAIFGSCPASVADCVHGFQGK